ncbi:MAG: hypothetical protein RSB55_03100 [Oscillospiraceae bacterium]
MASAVKQRTRYETYGSEAYDPAYLPGREREEERRPLVRPRERVEARPRALVREPGRVSIFGVVGFLAVGVVAVLLLLCYCQITATGDSIVRMKSELSALQEENVKLLTQYELAYDLKTIESEVTAEGTMVRPQSGQTVTLDLSEPDSVVTYAKEDTGGKVKNVLLELKQAAENVIAYFH